MEQSFKLMLVCSITGSSLAECMMQIFVSWFILTTQISFKKLIHLRFTISRWILWHEHRNFCLDRFQTIQRYPFSKSFEWKDHRRSKKLGNISLYRVEMPWAGIFAIWWFNLGISIATGSFERFAGKPQAWNHASMKGLCSQSVVHSRAKNCCYIYTRLKFGYFTASHIPRQKLPTKYQGGMRLPSSKNELWYFISGYNCLCYFHFVNYFHLVGMLSNQTVIEIWCNNFLREINSKLNNKTNFV